MTCNFNSGLSLQVSRPQPVYLTRLDCFSVIIEMRLASTNPKHQQAIINTVVHGERVDLKSLGIPETGRAHLITANGPTEIAPGVLVTIRKGGNRSPVTAHTIALVISADPVIWRIERKTVMEARLREGGKA
jgi:hypothetical protein